MRSRGFLFSAKSVPFVTWTSPHFLFMLSAGCRPREHSWEDHLSSRVQNARAVTAHNPQASSQSWIMLLLESLSAGVMTIFVFLFVGLVAVSLFLIMVWPLTFWDLSNLGLERFAAWVKPLLWSLFAAGSLAGYLCFGGAAFKIRRKSGTPTPARSTK
jgi:hypothetical protein